MKISFVLGAGASTDFGYPSGKDLFLEIMQDLNKKGEGETPLRGLLRKAGNTPEQIDELRDALYVSERETIDEFIASHGNRESLRRVCREAIALVIACRENEQKLFGLGHHWYRRLLTFLRSRPNLLRRDHFTFFTFNYDRSLEHYLYRTVKEGGDEFAQKDLKEFFHDNFFHIHGAVGRLPWQSGPATDVIRAYGKDIDTEQLRKLGDGLLTADQEATIGAELKKRLLDSDVVIILGFGFAPQNRTKIHFDELVSQKRLMWITATNNQYAEALKEHPFVEIMGQDCNHAMTNIVQRWQTGQWLQGLI